MSQLTCSPGGSFKEYIGIITEKQLTDRALWKKCVDVFSSGIDNPDAGWRGEYWGKMMRGACLIYRTAPSEKLLDTLTEAVNGLLAKQEPDGRISTYRADAEFFGWDMWARKYVMTGLQHFYDICPDEALKEKIMTALIAHADYIVDKIGDDKIPILTTGQFWGGVNSASILEPFVRLYKDTGDEKYLAFARYIISTGGCRDGDLIAAALAGKLPFEFPEQKAYETMSFFEGLLAYYEVTGDKRMLEAVKKFTEGMLSSDVTVIGSCGCTHELFDNSHDRQTEHTGKIMQETCVTVTLIRFLSRLFRVTKDKKLTDVIRLAALNALAGALNVNGFDQFSNELKEYLPGLLFDSYSPLCDSKRGLGIGGFKKFEDGSFFGCCACIASAGFALYPLMSVTEDEDGFRFNYLVPGEYSFTRNGGKVTFTVTDKKIAVSAQNAGEFTVRITNGDDTLRVKAFSGEKTIIIKDEGFIAMGGEWTENDEIVLETEELLTETVINGKSSFNLGGTVLAVDTAKEPAYVPGSRIRFLRDENGALLYEKTDAPAGSALAVLARTAEGKLLLTDYASAGQDGKSIVNVWFG